MSEIYEFTDEKKWNDTRLVLRYRDLDSLMEIPRQEGERKEQLQTEMANIAFEVFCRIHYDLNDELYDEVFYRDEDQ